MPSKIVITGAAGFIGSCLISKFNNEGEKDLILVDDFSNAAKESNFSSKTFSAKVERDIFPDWLKSHHSEIKQVIHIGARTDTTEFDRSIFEKLNLGYTKQLWRICAENQIPLIYASSAATYGLGEFGYKDDETLIPQLKPLNPYGDSKNDFDKWCLQQKETPPHWYGLKFFNVYGPNEYHKGRMASVIFHAFNQVKAGGKVKLFKSHRPDYKDGGQLRDFVYVKDVVEVIWFLFRQQPKNGIYNLGSGTARSFEGLALAVFSALNKQPDIEYIDTPADIRDKYQYFTEADMSKLRSAGYNRKFSSLEEGVKDYVQNYLEPKRYL